MNDLEELAVAARRRPSATKPSPVPYRQVVRRPTRASLLTLQLWLGHVTTISALIVAGITTLFAIIAIAGAVLSPAPPAPPLSAGGRQTMQHLEAEMTRDLDGIARVASVTFGFMILSSLPVSLMIACVGQILAVLARNAHAAEGRQQSTGGSGI